MTTLLADSGSTKTNWVLISPAGNTVRYDTEGINPVVGSKEIIENTIGNHFVPQLKGVKPDEIYFYGAGCTQTKKGVVEDILKKYFPKAHIEVASDVLAAARALCGHEEGIACILGTGSNSCLYDGKDIVRNISPLGYILGDEASGAVLGKHLVGDILKRQLPEDICELFYQETNLTEAEIIDRVYSRPMPNRFLASLVPFIQRHHRESEIGALLVANFRNFLRRNVIPYNRPDLSVNFIGGVAHSFGDEITAAVHVERLIMGNIRQSPLSGLIKYHSVIKSDVII